MIIVSYDNLEANKTDGATLSKSKNPLCDLELVIVYGEFIPFAPRYVPAIGTLST